jgi:hypothetical protein
MSHCPSHPAEVSKTFNLLAYSLCGVESRKAGSLKMNTALEYSTRVVQEGGRRCKKTKEYILLTI